MDWLVNTEMWAALIALTAMEIVLGIDNIVFISILSGRLPPHQQKKARLIGLALAMISRIALLVSLAWIMSLTRPFMTLLAHELSGRDLILLGGGLFLVAKATREIHHKLEGTDEEGGDVRVYPSLISTLIQIMILDIVFSLDSVITAVGMADQLWIMIVAVMVAVVFMMAFSGWISSFIDEHPTIKMLALSFLVLIGVVLVAEGFGQHISKGYIYSAMAFSVFVEMLNARMLSRASKRAREKASAGISGGVK